MNFSTTRNALMAVLFFLLALSTAACAQNIKETKRLAENGDIDAQNTLGVASDVAVADFDQLYGVSLGAPMTSVSKVLGEPDQVIEIEDGSKASVYQRDDHYVVFIAAQDSEAIIVSIQLSGVSSPLEKSLSGIQLGMPFDEVKKRLGDPSESEIAIDRVTGESVAGTTIHWYGPTASFEAKAGIVSSIKIETDMSRDGVLSSDDPADIKAPASYPEPIRKVQNYILNTEYPEDFGDKRYPVAVKDMHVIDLDRDGEPEVVVLYKPHFLQSPTIVIYRLIENGKVERVREGFAPGPLVPRGEYFLDSHALRAAVDYTLTDEAGSSVESEALALPRAVDSGMLVQYADFFHLDTRNGPPSYIDMSEYRSPSGELDCSGFEFSAVDTIVVGTVTETGGAYIAAIVGSKVYIYEIVSIDKQGFIEKRVRILENQKEA